MTISKAFDPKLRLELTTSLEGLHRLVSASNIGGAVSALFVSSVVPCLCVCVCFVPCRAVPCRDLIGRLSSVFGAKGDDNNWLARVATTVAPCETNYT